MRKQRLPSLLLYRCLLHPLEAQETSAIHKSRASQARRARQLDVKHACMQLLTRQVTDTSTGGLHCSTQEL